MEIQLTRSFFAAPTGKAEGYTLGELWQDSTRIGYTVEDQDRHLEIDPKGKVYGKTCIPRGRYKLELTFSHRFQKLLPLIVDVPGFEGIRIHGGNRAENSQGCIILGRERTNDGVKNCRPVMVRIISLLVHAEARDETCWITIS